ncbi:MAG: ABC transporter permease, partial [Candidatus Aureabacteria bacterium]|nr:ABC transporter permease [Candidatus Auribacterota bacterium]
MLIFKLAKRNLWRNKRRTIITMVSIAFGVLLCMFFTGTSDGSYEKLINTAARLGHGHITIMNKNFLRSQDSSYAIPNAVFIEKALSSMKEITFMEKKISGSGMLSSAYDSIAVAFDAVEMDKNQKYSIIKEKITEGSFLTEDKRDVLIGKTLAERLNLQIGSKVVLTVNDRENEITQELFRVRGIYSTGSDLSDGFYAVFHLSKIREVLKYGEEEASIIALYTSHYRDVDKVIKKIKNEHPSFFKGSTQIYPWHEVMEELAQWISVDTGSNYIMQ